MSQITPAITETNGKPHSCLWPRLILAAAVLLAFFPTLFNDFVSWDDGLLIYSNKYFLPVTWHNIALFWKEPVFRIYMPLTYSTWAALALPGQNGSSGAPTFHPALFHAVNLLVHVANSLLVYGLLRRFIKHEWPACLGTLLWAVHPLQVESVVWASELKGLLAAFWGLSFIHLHLSLVSTDHATKTRGLYFRYAAATCCLLLAFFSKPSAACLPLMAGCLDLFLTKETPVKVLKRLIPWMLVTLPFIFIARGAQMLRPDYSPPWGRPFIALDALAFYLGKIIFPKDLQIVYGRTPAVVLKSTATFFTCIVPLALLCVLWFARERESRLWPWLSAGFFLFVLALSPNLGLVPFLFQQYSTVADRYMYLALLGPALVFAACLTGWPSSSRPPERISPVAVGLGITLIALLGVCTSRQIPNWHSNLELWSYNLSVDPNRWALHYNIGTTLLAQDRHAEALPYLQKAATLAPDEPDVETDLGSAYAKLGRLGEAALVYEKALTVDHTAKPRVLLANVRREQGKQDEALKLYQEALKLNSDSQEAHYNLGVLLMDKGQMQEAISHFQEALRIEPDAATHDVLALALARSGDVKQAREHWDDALKLDPRYAPALVNLGTLMAMQKDYKAAAEKWTLALEIDPDNAEVHHNLASLLLADGHKKEAIEHWKTALRLKPNYPEARDALDKALRHPTR